MAAAGRERVAALLVAAAVAAATGLGALATGALGPLEDDLVDKRFQLRPAVEPAEVAVVAVDDVTFDELDQRWPLPRSQYGRAVRRLERAGAREVVVDVQFTEPTEPAEDFALYDSIDRAGGAILATSETDGHGATKVLGGDENLAAIGARAAAANLPDARGGVIRRFTHSVGGLETIAVATAARARKPVAPSAFESSGALIDFRGGPGTVPTLSLSRVIDGRFDPADVRGRIVVIGASSPTVQDLHPTPTTGGGPQMPGPEIQANAIWTALQGLPLRSAPKWLDTVLLLLAAIAMPVLVLRHRVLRTLVALPLLLLAAAVGAQIAFQAGLVVTLAPVLATLAVGGLATVVAEYQREWRERRRVARLNAELDEQVRERTRELAEAQLEVIRRLGHAVESRDEETGDHVGRISRLSQRLALAAGLDPEQAELIGQASVMHDVGKIGVPDRILQKPGKLDEDEWVVMRTHTTLGAEILAGSRAPLIQMAEVIARTHHERWDGTGYPAGLAGEEIPLAGRICAVCDVFDALTSERPYKRAWPVQDALDELRAVAGRHLDARLVELFVPMIATEDPTIAERIDGSSSLPLAA